MKKIVFVFFMLFVALASMGQIEFNNVEALDRIKHTTTYITFKDTNSAVAKQYMDIYRKYWTISKIQFINDTDIDEHISLESSFLTMTYYNPTMAYIMYNPIYSPVYNGNYNAAASEYSSQMNTQVNAFHHAHTYQVCFLYMSLWMYKPNYIKKKDKRDAETKDEIAVSRIALFPDYNTLLDPSGIYQYDYDWGGHIKNWGPGMLKNYIQGLMTYFNAGKQFFFEYNEIENKQQLVNLQGQTLYIPDYVLNIYGGVGRDQTTQHDPKDLFKDYPYSYTLIPTAELNNKILNSATPLYYLIYVKDNGNKLITVINSQTGEIVYSECTKMSYNVKSGDFKDLAKSIKKSK